MSNGANQMIFTKKTYLIEEVNASGSYTAPIAVCSDLHQAIAWAYCTIPTAFSPSIRDIDGNVLSIDGWAFNIVAGVYIVPTVGSALEVPMQRRVRMIEELTLS